MSDPSGATTGAILITASTFEEAKQFVEASPLGERAVRGLATPVEVFQLTGLKHAPASERFRSGPFANAVNYNCRSGRCFSGNWPILH